MKEVLKVKAALKVHDLNSSSPPVEAFDDMEGVVLEAMDVVIEVVIRLFEDAATLLELFTLRLEPPPP